MTMSLNSVATVEKQWAEAALTVVEEVKVKAEAKGVKAKAVTTKSDLTAESIISVAKKNKCDLIVMASHGRRGLKRVLLGSETTQVLTHSHIPVLVLR
jgi:nucleotide-binding universal stress UspA family protein